MFCCLIFKASPTQVQEATDVYRRYFLRQPGLKDALPARTLLHRDSLLDGPLPAAAGQGPAPLEILLGGTCLLIFSAHWLPPALFTSTQDVHKTGCDRTTASYPTMPLLCSFLLNRRPDPHATVVGSQHGWRAPWQRRLHVAACSSSN